MTMMRMEVRVSRTAHTSGPSLHVPEPGRGMVTVIINTVYKIDPPTFGFSNVHFSLQRTRKVDNIDLSCNRTSKSNIPDVKILILTSSFVQCILVRVGHYIIIHIHSSFNKTRGMSKVLIFNKNMMNHVAYLTTCNL